MDFWLIFGCLKGGGGGVKATEAEVPTGSGRRCSGSEAEVNRRRQQLKALSEGTILLDRRKALRFASGYVDVNVHGNSPINSLINSLINVA